MKFSFVINQAGVVAAGLLGKVSVEALCLLHYMRGWFDFGRAKIKVVEHRKFVWLRYERAIDELPLLFNPHAKLTSRKNQLSALVENLRVSGLIVTVRVNRHLYFRLTDSATNLSQHYQRGIATDGRSAPNDIESHDNVVTSKQVSIITSLRDEYLPANIEETGTKEPERSETPPVSPFEGEAEDILTHWNSFTELKPVLKLTPNRLRQIHRRLADPFWRDQWRKAIERIGTSDMTTGGGPSGWRATFDWFLQTDSLVRIMEGQYDNRTLKASRPRRNGWNLSEGATAAEVAAKARDL